MNAWRLLYTFALLLVSAAAAHADAGLFTALHIGPVRLSFPGAWTFNSGQRHIKGTAANGEAVDILVFVSKEDVAPTSHTALTDRIRREAQQMSKLFIEDSGWVVRHLTELPAPPGKVLFAAASEELTREGEKQHSLIYVLGSAKAQVFLSLTGKGGAVKAFEVFDAVATSQQWSE